MPEPEHLVSFPHIIEANAIRYMGTGSEFVISDGRVLCRRLSLTAEFTNDVDGPLDAILMVLWTPS